MDVRAAKRRGRKAVFLVLDLVLSVANRSIKRAPLDDSFLDEHSKAIDKRKEAVEHCLIKKYIARNSTVLEIGARFGTSSCAITWHLDQEASSWQTVSVEADPAIWEAIERNLNHNKCRSHLIKGVLSSTPMLRSAEMAGSAWTTKFHPVARDFVANTNTTASLSPAHTPAELSERYRLRFDTLVVDCEGCFEGILHEFTPFVASLHTVILEADYGIGMQALGYVDYSALTMRMLGLGFVIAEQFLHPCCNWPHTTPMIVFTKPPLPIWRPVALCQLAHTSSHRKGHGTSGK